MRTSGTRSAAITSVTSASGTTRTNTERHDAVSTRNPPRIGPPALVRAVAADHVPMARPRSAFGNAALRSARLFGTSSALPTPCTARATMSCAAVVVSAAAADASARMPSPSRKSRRRPKRSPAEPAASVRAARKSV
jgi:hypothetical protein